MSSFGVVFLSYCRKKMDDKVMYTLFCKEQFQFMQTAHPFHLVDPSPWPLMASLGGFMLTSGLVLYMNKFIGG